MLMGPRTVFYIGSSVAQPTTRPAEQGFISRLARTYVLALHRLGSVSPAGLLFPRGTCCASQDGGRRGGNRTPDHGLIRAMLSPLSYSPTKIGGLFELYRTRTDVLQRHRHEVWLTKPGVPSPTGRRALETIEIAGIPDRTRTCISRIRNPLHILCGTGTKWILVAGVGVEPTISGV